MQSASTQVRLATISTFKIYKDTSTRAVCTGAFSFAAALPEPCKDVCVKLKSKKRENPKPKVKTKNKIKNRKGEFKKTGTRI